MFCFYCFYLYLIKAGSRIKLLQLSKISLEAFAFHLISRTFHRFARIPLKGSSEAVVFDLGFYLGQKEALFHYFSISNFVLFLLSYYILSPWL